MKQRSERLLYPQLFRSSHFREKEACIPRCSRKLGGLTNLLNSSNARARREATLWPHLSQAPEARCREPLQAPLRFPETSLRFSELSHSTIPSLFHSSPSPLGCRVCPGPGTPTARRLFPEPLTPVTSRARGGQGHLSATASSFCCEHGLLTTLLPNTRAHRLFINSF